MMLRTCNFISVLAILLFCGTAGGGTGGDVAVDRLLGQRMYREGILPSGEPMTGKAQAGAVRQGKDAACSACHRRSGFGTTEGTYVIRPITGPDLYQTRSRVSPSPRIEHQLGRPLRAAYDNATLAKAIRDGIDVTGHTLRNDMPRFALSDADMRVLTAYLKTLFADPAPGVSETEIHLATVIQPGVSSEKRRAMLEVIDAFIRDKNAGVRSEELRRKVGIMRMNRAYRKWVLHVWQLEGPQATWGRQLEARYREQPVFALVSGLGDANWQPIHEFSESFEVPCILPLTDLPVLSGDNFYTVYFSRGISLEAEALAKFLDDHPDRQKIIQVYRADDVGAVAAKALRAALTHADHRLEDRPLVGPASSDFWRDLASQPSTRLILWLRPQDLDLAKGFLPGNTNVAIPQAVYLSATLLEDLRTLPAGEGVLMTYPWEMPEMREQTVLRTKQWLRGKGISSPEEDVMINTHFAITIAGDALAHMMDSFSREYFVERVEHIMTTTIMPSYFPRVSLGPDQRFASKGIYIVRADGRQGRKLVAVSELIVP